MDRLYFYPPSSISGNKSIPNPYVRNLKNSLSNLFIIVNDKKPAKNGLFDILKYLNKIDYICFNWIEELPDKKGGIAQFFLFLFLMFLFKIKGVKVIWVLHNKESHYQTNRYMKKTIMNLLIKQSDFIITHSSDGIKFLNDKGRNRLKKSIYIPHPVIKKEVKPSEIKEYDILIWGSIKEYKGIDRFLEFLHKKNIAKKYTILIAGKIIPQSYKSKLIKYITGNITLFDEFISDKDVENYASKSKIILFPYLDSAVLSSGALMDSLSFGAKIIGPHAGAFSDLSKEGIVYTYNNYDDLIEKINNLLKADNDKKNVRVKNFIENNSWGKFNDKLLVWIND